VPDNLRQAPEPAQHQQLISEVAARLQRHRSLLALDNCEQLLDVLPSIVQALLADAPNLTVLATSREPLGITGEIVIDVPPMDLPPRHLPGVTDHFEHVESVALFMTRARERGAPHDMTPQNATVLAQVIHQLDGVPLAIELAAARLQSTSLHDLSTRLNQQLEVLAGRSSDERHQTLRNTYDWSYNLLDSSQQLLLRRLGVFVGGFTLDAAEKVCGGGPDDELPSANAVYVNLAELVATVIGTVVPDVVADFEELHAQHTATRATTTRERPATVTAVNDARHLQGVSIGGDWLGVNAAVVATAEPLVTPGPGRPHSARRPRHSPGRWCGRRPSRPPKVSTNTQLWCALGRCAGATHGGGCTVNASL
jgi:hypothetical protein